MTAMHEAMKAPSIRYQFEAYRGRVVRPARLVSVFGLPIFRQRRLVVPAEMKWQDAIDNLVTTAGKNDLLDKYFGGSGYTAAWYVGLIDNSGYSAVDATDTMGSHTGWAEADEYDEATREQVSFAAASSASKAASAATEFTINATIGIRGAFLTSVSTKNGTTGVLYSAAAFAANRSLVDNDILRVTPTYSQT